MFSKSCSFCSTVSCAHAGEAMRVAMRLIVRRSVRAVMRVMLSPATITAGPECAPDPTPVRRSDVKVLQLIRAELSRRRYG